MFMNWLSIWNAITQRSELSANGRCNASAVIRTGAFCKPHLSISATPWRSESAEMSLAKPSAPNSFDSM